MADKRKPDYRLAALDKNTGLSGNVGAAWVNEDQSITVILDSFVVLEGGKQLGLTLFKNKWAKE